MRQHDILNVARVLPEVCQRGNLRVGGQKENLLVLHLDRLAQLRELLRCRDAGAHKRLFKRRNGVLRFPSLQLFLRPVGRIAVRR